MDRSALVWIVLVLSALISGAALVAVLSLRQNLEPAMSLIGLLSFGTAAYCIVLISGAYGRVDAVLYALTFMAAAAAGGWSLASSLLERVSDTPAPLSVPEALPQPVEGTAVILVACAEPSRYDPRQTGGMLQSLAEEELLEPSIGSLPFMFFAQKTRYRAIGGTSPAFAQLTALAEKVELALGGNTHFAVHEAECSGSRRLGARVVDAVSAGFRRVVIVPVGVAESLHLAQAKREVDYMRLEERGVSAHHTDSLEDADRIIDMLAKRVLATAETPTSTGVVLVGHGQPDERSRRNPDMDIKENAFLSRLRMQLLDAGMLENNVRIAWMEWRSPDLTSSVRHLAALGCRRIVVVPGVFPFDCIATKLDLELAVRQARPEDSLTVVTLPAWRDDQAVVDELCDRIRRLTQA